MNSTLVIVILAAIVILGSVMLVIVGMRTRKRQEEDPLADRLAEFSARGESVDSLEQLELSQPFSERVLVPMLRRIGEMSIRFTPQKVLEETAVKLERAGNPLRVDASTFLASRFVLAAFFGGFIVLFYMLAPTKWPVSTLLLLVTILVVLGFFFPQLYLTGEIQKRQKDIRKAMPDALDLLTICVEAGLGLDAAMAKVAEKWENHLSMAFTRVIREVQLGKLRRDAMRDMSERVGIPEMTSFVAAIIQSEMLGVSMARVLRIQSEQMRVRRRQMAEEEAHKAPIKMIFPMGLLIFPALMIVLLTPAILTLWTTFESVQLF